MAAMMMGITRQILCISLALVYSSRAVFAHEEKLELPHSKLHSLMKPFHVMGTSTPHWDIFGNAMVTSEYIRLTSDKQGLSGGIRNQVPVKSNWEVHLHFKIHGKSATLFGDGMAFWYLTEQLKPGPVFGASDHFSGIAVIVDTYKNHKEHHKSMNSKYPRIAVMVNNGSLTYNHDRDGIPAVVGWCEAQVRKTLYETHVSIRYENNELLVQTDIEGNRKWKQCVHLKRLNLPTNGFFGLSASTGDLSDNHDVLSFKTYELDSELDQDRRAFVPAVSYEGPVKKASGTKQDTFHWRLFFLLFFVVLGGIFISSILYLYWQDRRELARQKRLS